LSKVNPIDAVL